MLLCADMFGAANLGCYGDRSGVSPHVDALAAEGVRFEQAYCACPPCIPARVSMMSGQYARTHGKLAHLKMPLTPEPPLLPRLLSAAGYRTAIVGKTHWWPPASTLGADEAHLTIDTHLTPELGGDDAYIRSLESRGLFHYDAERWTTDRPRLEPDRLPFAALKPNWVGDTALDVLDRYAAQAASHAATATTTGDGQADSGQPLFLLVSFVEPHGAGNAPSDYIARFSDAELPPVVGRPGEHDHRPAAQRRALQRWRTSAEDIDRYRRGVYAGFALVDENVGRILTRLTDLGLRDDTVVLFTTDHGDLMYDHGCIEKTFLYEPAIRVPLIAAGPGLPVAAVRDQLVSHVDLLPTLLQLANGHADPATATGPMPQVDGHSLLPLIADSDAEWRDTLYCEVEQTVHLRGATASSFAKMVRRGPWKYLYTLVDGHEVGEELYRLDQDPNELENLAGDGRCGDRLVELRSELLRWLVATDVGRLHPAAENHYPVPAVPRRWR